MTTYKGAGPGEKLIVGLGCTSALAVTVAAPVIIFNLMGARDAVRDILDPPNPACESIGIPGNFGCTDRLDTEYGDVFVEPPVGTLPQVCEDLSVRTTLVEIEGGEERNWDFVSELLCDGEVKWTTALHHGGDTKSETIELGIRQIAYDTSGFEVWSPESK